MKKEYKEVFDTVKRTKDLLPFVTDERLKHAINTLIALSEALEKSNLDNVDLPIPPSLKEALETINDFCNKKSAN